MQFELAATIHILFVFSIEEHFTSQHLVEYRANAEYVCLTVVAFAL